MSFWLLVALAGCDKRTPGGHKQETDTPKETTPETTSDCAVYVFDADGGVISQDNVSLTIPIDALDGPTDLFLCPAAAPEGFVLRSGAWELRADGLRWPVEVSLVGSEGDGALFVPDPNGTPMRSIEAVGDGTTLTAPMYREGVFFIAQDEHVVAPYTPQNAVDMLFVVDNSCSMSPYQDELAARFPEIFEMMLDRVSDFHVGVVSTDLDSPSDDGKLRESSGVRWVEPMTPDPERVFSDMVRMGTTGSGTERGIGATYKALEVHGDDYNAGFLREGTHLSIVVMSDEADQTQPNLVTPTELSDYLLDLEITRPEVSFHSLVTPVGLGAGVEYFAVTMAVGGFYEDIRTADWQPFFDDVVGEIGSAFFVLSPPAAVQPTAFVDPASGAEPFELPAESITFDPVSQTLTVTDPQIGSGDIVWLLYLPS